VRQAGPRSAAVPSRVRSRSPEPLGFERAAFLLGRWNARSMTPEVRDGFAPSALLGSGFDDFRYDLLGDEASRPAFAERVTMSRFLVEQYDLRRPARPARE
jgi:hypothetical protein